MNYKTGFGAIGLIIGIFILASIAGGAYYFTTQQKEDDGDAMMEEKGGDAMMEENDSMADELDAIPGWSRYHNDDLGFEFQYPASVTLGTGESVQHLNRSNSPVVSATDDVHGALFTVVTTDVVRRDEAGNYSYSEGSSTFNRIGECTEPFFGNVSTPSANTSFGDGFCGRDFYNIVTAAGDNLAVTYGFCVEQEPYISEETRQNRIQRGKLRADIFATFQFDEPTRDFSCDN
jgi:hypothetical protein